MRTQRQLVSLESLASCRVAVIAAGAHVAARADLEALGAEIALVLDAGDLASLRWRLRATISDVDAEVTVLHTPNWRRQAYPQVFELALALAPTVKRWRFDASNRGLVDIDGPVVARGMARFAVDAVRAAGVAARESALVRGLSPARVRRPRLAEDGGNSWMLAMWRSPGDAGVGGSVTHMSGILGGFRALGLKVALITDAPPPAQLAPVLDRVEVIAAASEAARVTRDIERLFANRAFRAAGRRLAQDLQPAFVYQRHDYLFTGGAAVAIGAGIPLVLEWNNSMNAPMVQEWMTPSAIDKRLRRFLGPLGVRMEERTVRLADLVVAVSETAAQMALTSGADPSAVVIVPNGVDTQAVRPGPPLLRVNEAPTLGWIGSFGPWHGAEMVVKALALLPGDVRAVMIGEGPELASCQALAKHLNVDRQISFPGVLAHADAVAALAATDVLLSPHIPMADGTPFFGSPTKLFEYMAIGRPIVASDLEQIGEILTDGRTALLVPPGDASALAAAIAELIASNDRGAALGAAARLEAVQLHTWSARARTIWAHLVRVDSCPQT